MRKSGTALAAVGLLVSGCATTGMEGGDPVMPNRPVPPELPAEFAEQTEGVSPETAEAARKGQAEACVAVAKAYENGSGAIPQDVTKAVAWYRDCAAPQGNIQARFRLGYLHEVGKGNLAQDYEAAAIWYRLVAEENPVGKFNLANLYIRGQGVPEDRDKAVQLWEEIIQHEAADNEPIKTVVTVTMRNLGLHHLSQPGEQAKAVQLLKKAADRGDQRAAALMKRLDK